MRKIYLFTLLLLAMIFSCVSSAFSNNQTIVVNQSKQSSLNLVNSMPDKLEFTSTVGWINIRNVKTDNGTFVRLNIDKFGKSSKIGFPELPVMHKLIEIPLNAEVEIKITNYKITEYNLTERGIITNIIPRQPSQPKCGNSRQFEIDNNTYATNAYYQEELVSIDVLGVLRGANIGRLNISPIRYNPVTNIIQVVDDVEFEVYFHNADLHSTVEQKDKTRSPYFDGIYNQLLNNQYQTNTRDYITQYPVSYIIVSDRMFEDQLQPFIAWKQRKGFTVTEAYTDEIGTSLQQIKDFIEGLYNAGTPENPSPSFVLFVGDVAQIPAWNNGDGVTDRNYVEYTGDLFPEIFYGRFSAENTVHLQPYIDKTLMYEQYTMPNPSYLDTVVMVSGVDGSYATDWGNGQINYGTINYFNEDHDIFSNTYLYPASGSSSAAIIQNVSDGVTFGNYTAHCSPNGWANPSFVISDIAGLENQDKYGLLIGNCCSSSEFQTVCFGEEILRAENKGAIGYIGGSNSTYWDEDYYFGVGVGVISENPPPYEETTLGNYDRSFHDHGEPFSDWFTTMDQVIFAGNLAVSESGSNLEDYYWDIYNLMGDPSLMIYYSIPDENWATHDPYIMIGTTSFTINTAPYSYIALNRDNQNIVSVLADENGLAVLEFTGFAVPGYAELVISAQNYQPYIEDIQIFAPDGPYCIYEQHTINDDSLGNGNNKAEYNEQVFINLSMINYGNDDAVDVNVTISTACTDVVIEDAGEIYDTILVNEIVTRENGFLIQLSDDIEDMTTMIFDVIAVDSQDSTWESQFEITAFAPKLTPLDLIVDDSETGNDNGRLDPGESAIIKIKTTNTGHCVAYNVTASLLAYNPYVTVLSGDTTLPLLSTFGASYPQFEVVVADDAPIGVFAEMRYQLSSGGYFVERPYYPKMGLLLEDWETGNFSKFEWQFGGHLPWVISNAYPYEGNYDVISGTIGNSQTSEFWIQYQVMSSDSISFYKKVSSEVDYDKLKFFIDNTLQDEWSGTSQSWTRETYAVNAGVRKFRWVYQKDFSGIGGADKAWVDYIELPTMMVTTVYAGPDDHVCENNVFQCAGSATNYDSVLWETSGTGSFDNPQLLNPIYTPSDNDILIGNVLLSLNIIDVDGLPASDEMILSFNYLPTEPAMPVGPEQIDLQVVTESEYTTEITDGADLYLWTLYPQDAGTISGTGITGTVTWYNQYEGEAWVKVVGENNCGQGEVSDSLLVIVSNPVGINKIYEDLTVSIIPNPNNGRFVLVITSPENSIFDVSMVNALGKKIIESYANDFSSVKEKSFDVSNVPEGLYFIIVQNSTKRIAKKLLIKNK
ncbi:MAG: T9SS type A sorting domain-containing protein [Bacteroidetes bacterium]|nr:T9SS type A sorting domain-containing protein [Bacteroidota bacterium]MBL6943358.1 T9SS type A sorting domain-containing protein [Bacteroidales bacterium]